MSAVEFPSYNKRDSMASISSAFDFRQFTPTNKNAGNEFLGLSLPLDLSTLFQVTTGGLESHLSKFGVIRALFNRVSKVIP